MYESFLKCGYGADYSNIRSMPSLNMIKISCHLIIYIYITYDRVDSLNQHHPSPLLGLISKYLSNIIDSAQVEMDKI